MDEPEIGRLNRKHTGAAKWQGAKDCLAGKMKILFDGIILLHNFKFSKKYDLITIVST
jgi:hypothetical protein